MAHRVSREIFASLVEEALADLPEEFAKFLEEVPLEIHALPTATMVRGMKQKPGTLLLGLYRGRPRTVRHVEDSGVMPDVIYIFQENIEQVCNSDAELIEQVRTTVLHEIGHHFGMSETDLDKLGYG